MNIKKQNVKTRRKTRQNACLSRMKKDTSKSSDDNDNNDIQTNHGC